MDCEVLVRMETVVSFKRILVKNVASPAEAEEHAIEMAKVSQGHHASVCITWRSVVYSVHETVVEDLTQKQNSSLV